MAVVGVESTESDAVSLSGAVAGGRDVSKSVFDGLLKRRRLIVVEALDGFSQHQSGGIAKMGCCPGEPVGRFLGRISVMSSDPFVGYVMGYDRGVEPLPA